MYWSIRLQLRIFKICHWLTQFLLIGGKSYARFHPFLLIRVIYPSKMASLLGCNRFHLVMGKCWANVKVIPHIWQKVCQIASLSFSYMANVSADILSLGTKKIVCLPSTAAPTPIFWPAPKLFFNLFLFYDKTCCFQSPKLDDCCHFGFSDV